MNTQHQILSMSSNSLTGETTFRVELFKDLGIARISKGVMEVKLPEKFEGIDSRAETAIADFIQQNAIALGLKE